MGEGAGGIQNTSFARIILEGSSGESSESGDFPNNVRTVSYTHLTLPTICSV